MAVQNGSISIPSIKMQNDFKQEEKEEESYVNSLSHRA
jgi:hypothetical protein